MAKYTGMLQAWQAKQVSDSQEAKDALDQRRLDMAEEQFTESKKMSRLELLTKYGTDSKANKASAKTKADELTRLIAIGLPDDVAQYVHTSGEGTEILKTYDKVASGKQSSAWIPSLVKRVQEYLGDDANAENVAIAFKAGLLSGEDLSTDAGQQASLIESIYAATSLQDFKSVDEQLAKIISAASENSDATIRVDPVGNLTSGTNRIDEARQAAIEREVIKRVSPSFGGFFEGVDPEGYPIFNPNNQVGGVDATKFRSLIDDAVANISTNLQGVGAADVTENQLIQTAADVIISYAPSAGDQSSQPITTEEDSLDPTLVTPPLPVAPLVINETFEQRLKRLELERKGN